MSHARVLIIDDDCDFADSLAEALTLQGHHITIANSGESALRKLRNQSFDITFLDFMLPGKNGVELFADIRALYPQARVMMMTGYAKENMLDSVMKRGALGVLDKPLDLNMVMNAIEKASPDGTVLVADDDEDFVESISDILSACGHTVLTAGNGREAIKMIREHDIDVLVLDLKMPGLNGHEVYIELQSLDIKPATIVVTGFMEEDIESLNSLTKLSRADALIKPFDPEMLLDQVQKLISDTTGANTAP